MWKVNLRFRNHFGSVYNFSIHSATVEEKKNPVLVSLIWPKRSLYMRLLLVRTDCLCGKWKSFAQVLQMTKSFVCFSSIVSMRNPINITSETQSLPPFPYSLVSLFSRLHQHFSLGLPPSIKMFSNNHHQYYIYRLQQIQMPNSMEGCKSRFLHCQTPQYWPKATTTIL